MAKVLVTEAHLQAIADAIRTKNGKAVRYRPGDMATAILALEAGGAGGTTPPPTPPPTPPGGGVAPAGKTKVGSFTLRAKEDGSLSGYTAGKIMMALPNHKAAAFRAVVFCPTGLELVNMSVSDFQNGRAWTNTNAYVTSPTRVAVEGGTNYVMEWEEVIDVKEDGAYVYDDDKSNDKLTYYCCAEASVRAAAGGSTALDAASLTVEAFV